MLVAGVPAQGQVGAQMERHAVTAGGGRIETREEHVDRFTGCPGVIQLSETPATSSSVAYEAEHRGDRVVGRDVRERIARHSAQGWCCHPAPRPRGSSPGWPGTCTSRCSRHTRDWRRTKGEIKPPSPALGVILNGAYQNPAVIELNKTHTRAAVECVVEETRRRVAGTVGKGGFEIEVGVVGQPRRSRSGPPRRCRARPGFQPGPGQSVLRRSAASTVRVKRV